MIENKFISGIEKELQKDIDLLERTFQQNPVCENYKHSIPAIIKNISLESLDQLEIISQQNPKKGGGVSYAYMTFLITERIFGKIELIKRTFISNYIDVSKYEERFNDLIS